MNEAEIKELADTLEKDPRDWGGLKAGWKAAAELRRLVAINAELVEALDGILSVNVHSALTQADADAISAKAISALEKAKQ